MRHESPFSGVNYYRLQQVDFDGKFSYSPIVEVEIKSESDKLNVYPNPFTNEISVVLTNSLNKDAKINIYDVFGRLVSSDIIKEDQELIERIHREIKSKQNSERDLQIEINAYKDDNLRLLENIDRGMIELHVLTKNNMEILVDQGERLDEGLLDVTAMG